MKNKWVYLIGVVITAELAWFFWPTAEPTAELTPTPNRCPIHLPKGLPTGEATENDTIVVRDIYCLGADPDTKFADWVAYKLDRQTIGNSQTETERVWEPDPELDPAVTLEPEDYERAYKTLGIDRGHLAPLASFRGANWQQTNYLSNIVPQDSNFNRGVWADLEEDIRDMARTETIYVITGTAYLEEMPTLPGADEPHRIPSALWTIVDTKKGRQAWYFPQNTNATTPDEGAIDPQRLQDIINITIPQ